MGVCEAEDEGRRAASDFGVVETRLVWKVIVLGVEHAIGAKDGEGAEGNGLGIGDDGVEALSRERAAGGELLGDLGCAGEGVELGDAHAAG